MQLSLDKQFMSRFDLHWKLNVQIGGIEPKPTLKWWLVLIPEVHVFNMLFFPIIRFDMKVNICQYFDIEFVFVLQKNLHAYAFV